MSDPQIPVQRRLIICGLGELCAFRESAVSHVLSILDPGFPDPQDFSDYPPHQRLTLRFDDIIEPTPGMTPPELEDIGKLLAFGQTLGRGSDSPLDQLLVHCHMGISRSTAAMTILLAQAEPKRSEASLFAEITDIRPQAWPNSRMIAFADGLLGRKGRLTDALRGHYANQIAARPALVEMIRRVGRGAEVDMAA